MMFAKKKKKNLENTINKKAIPSKKKKKNVYFAVAPQTKFHQHNTKLPCIYHVFYDYLREKMK